MFRRWLLPVLIYLAVTVALTFPVTAHPASVVAHDGGDPILNTWILWWSTQATPFTARWWSAPIFFPMANAMALSEILIGLLPISAPVQWLTHSPLAAYNATVLASFPLCALATYALALELTGRRDAAFVAGLAFACAPYRMAQLSHVQMLSYYWAPLALLGLHRYLRTRAVSMLALFGAAWLMQSLSNGYAMFHLSVLVGLWMLWFARDIRTFGAVLAAWVLAALPMLPALLTYRSVHAYLHLVRDINEIKRFGADIADVLSAPPDLVIWGARLGSLRPETAIFPGLTIACVGAAWLLVEWRRGRFREEQSTPDRRIFIGLAVVAGLIAFSALSFGPWRIGPLTVTDFHKPFSMAVAFRLLASARSAWMRRAWREHSVVVFYLVAAIATYALALGPEPRLLGRPILYEPPYAWLMRLPGFEVLRVPARFAMLAVLCQSLLLAFAIARAPMAALRNTAVVATLCVCLLLDGWIRMPVAPAPESGPQWRNVAAVIELPPADPAVDFGALYRSMSHRLPLVNAFSGYYPPHYLPLAEAIGAQHFAAIGELAPAADIGIAMRRPVSGTLPAVDALQREPGVERLPSDSNWDVFVMHPRARLAVPRGTPLPISALVANRHPEDVRRMQDGTVETAWGSGAGQRGDEEVIVDLGAPHDIASIVFEMGAFSFGFPRQLIVDVSLDRATWSGAWSGETSVATVRAAVDRPGTVPLAIDFPATSARFVRLRQTGEEPGIPWWIAELSVLAPAGSRP